MKSLMNNKAFLALVLSAVLSLSVSLAFADSWITIGTGDLGGGSGSAPSVTGVSPNNGPNTSTTAVTISGTDFIGVTAVTIGTWPVSSYTVVDPSTITAVIQSGLPVSTYHVTVTNPYGTSPQTAADQFTVTSGGTPGVIIIDDYEDPNPRIYYNAGDVPPLYSVTTTDKHEGAKGIGIGYSYPGSGWGGLVGGILPNNLDISSATGISFWVKGDGSNNTIRIDLKEATNEAPANGEVYSSPVVSLSDTGWHKVEIPYSQFFRNPYDGVTGGNNTFDKKIFHYQLMYTGTNASAGTHFVDYIVAESITSSNTPEITSVIPNSGPNNATTEVVITGNNFGGVTAVRISTWPVSSYTVLSPTSITAVIPSGLPVATYHVTVTNPYGTSAQTPADQFTVTAGGSPDTEPPTPVFGNSMVKNGTDLTLGWTPATDNVGVAGYYIYRSTTPVFTPSAANRVGSSPTNNYTDIGALSAADSYYYKVKAFDAASNESATASNIGYKLNKHIDYKVAISNIYWVSIPNITPYKNARDIATDIPYATKVTRFNPSTQSYENLEKFLGNWVGTNFSVTTGESYAVVVGATSEARLVGWYAPYTINIPYNSAISNINWTSIPYNSVYSRVSEVAVTVPNATKIVRFNPQTQLYERWEKFLGTWIGTDFAITPGEGYGIIVNSNSAWLPGINE